MTRALVLSSLSLLTVAATIATALLFTPTAQASPEPTMAAAPLHVVESQIEAQVDARLHSILDGILAQSS